MYDRTDKCTSEMSFRSLLIKKYGSADIIMEVLGIRSVSYTHLDVYKRQIFDIM